MYDAFISYSHAADGKLAPALQQGLQGFAKPWYRRRAMRVFRDQTSLAASPELWPTIVRALEDARYFVLLASPEAAASRWVGREVAWWRENRSPQTMLIVLTGGDLVWDEAAGDVDWTRTTALPDELRGAFPAEPLWVDLRWVKNETDVSAKHPAFTAAVADLAATIRGIPKDELVGEDVRQHRRTRLTAAAALATLAALALAASGAGVVAVGQRDEAQRQGKLAVSHAVTAEAERVLAVDAQATTEVERAAAVAARATAEVERSRAESARATAESERAIAVSRQLAIQSQLLQDEDYATALLLATEATRQAPTTESRRALLSLLSARPELQRYLWNTHGPRSVVAFVDDGRRLVSTGTFPEPAGGVEEWDTARGEIVARITATANPGIGSAAAVSPDGQTLVLGGCARFDQQGLCSRGTIQFFAADSLAPRSDPIDAGTGEIEAIAFSGDGQRLATASGTDDIRLWEVSGRTQVANFASGLETGFGPVSLALSPDGSHLAVGGPNLSRGSGGVGIQLWDVASDPPRAGPHLAHDRRVVDVLFSNDGRRLIGGTLNGIFAWDLDAAPPAPVPLLAQPDIMGLAVHRPSELLYAVDLEGTVHILDLTTGAVIADLPDGEATSGALDIAVAPDGTHFAVQNSDAVVLWDRGGNNLRRELPVGATSNLALAGWLDATTLRVIEDDRRLVDVVAESRADAPAAPRPVAMLPSPGDTGPVIAATTSTIAWARLRDSVVLVTDLTSPPRRLDTGARVFRLALTPDGQTLVGVLDDKTVRSWRVSDFQEVGRISPFRAFDGSAADNGVLLVVSPSGTRVAIDSALGETIAVLALPTLQPVAEIALPPVTYKAMGMAFTPDDETLVVAGNLGANLIDPQSRRFWNISRWDFSDDAPVGAVLVDGAFFRDVAVSPDGRLLAYSEEQDQQTFIDLWDLKLGAALGRLGRESAVATLLFSPGGGSLAVAAASPDYESDRVTPRLFLYAVDLDAWRMAACRVVGRELTADEWRIYLGDLPQRPTCASAVTGVATPVAG